MDDGEDKHEPVAISDSTSREHLEAGGAKEVQEEGGFIRDESDNGLNAVETPTADSSDEQDASEARSSRSRTPPPSLALAGSPYRTGSGTGSSPPPTPPARLSGSASSTLAVPGAGGNRGASPRKAKKDSKTPPAVKASMTAASPANAAGTDATVAATTQQQIYKDSPSSPSSTYSQQSSPSSPSSSPVRRGPTNATTSAAPTDPSSPKASSSSSYSPSTSPTSSPRADAHGSSSPMQRQTAPLPSTETARPPAPARRVKVYALHESSWIDLGTGACTYHSGLARTVRKRTAKVSDNVIHMQGDPEEPREGDVTQLLEKEGSLESILGVRETWSDRTRAEASTSSGKGKENGRYDDAPEDGGASADKDPDLSGIASSNSIASSSAADDRKDLEQEAEEGAAWLRVRKENRWKTDPPDPSSSSPALKRKGKLKEKGKERASPTSADNVKAEDGGTKRRKAMNGHRNSKKRKLGHDAAGPASSPSDASALEEALEEDDPDNIASSSSSSSSSSSDEDISTRSSHSQSDSTRDTYSSIWEMRLEPPEPTGHLRMDYASFSIQYFGEDGAPAAAPPAGGGGGEEILGRYRRQQDTLIVWKTSLSLAQAFGIQLDNDAHTDLGGDVVGTGLDNNNSKTSGKRLPPILAGQDAAAARSLLAAGETELALSFAATGACAQVWEWLRSVHAAWQASWAQEHDYKPSSDDQLFPLDRRHTTSEGAETGLGDMEGDDEIESQIEEYINMQTQVGGSTGAKEATEKNGLKIAGSAAAAGYGLGLSMLHSQTPLQEPSLGNLVDLDKSIKMLGRTAVGRERTSSMINRTGFLYKLVAVFKEAEDLESISDLHAICTLLHTILNLNDHTLWEHVQEDDTILDLVSILEYDPEFGNMKATYRAHLEDPTLFVEVVPIRDELTKARIHQLYRLQYLKDVILPRVLDDSAFTTLNSFIYFHHVDIVQDLSSQPGFWKELLAFFPDTTSGSMPVPSSSLSAQEQASKQHDAIAFIQSYCQMVKQLQPGMRAQTFRALTEQGALRVLAFSLARMAPDNLHIRVATVEILMLLVDHDPNSIRAFVLKENDKPAVSSSTPQTPGTGKRKGLFMLLVETFHKEEDLGIKAQLAEAIRVLLLPPGDPAATETALARTRPDDPNADKFLQYFYENCVNILLEPLMKGLQAPPSLSASSASIATAPDSTTAADLASPQVALCTHLCELLCFFVVQHSFRSKFFILSSNISTKVCVLLTDQTKPKHVRLAALRYFRACIGRNDDFYNRYLVKNDGIIAALLALTKAEIVSDNLLASACLEFFEYIRLQNIKIFLNALMSDKFEKDIRALAQVTRVFESVIARWEQNNEPPPRTSSKKGASEQPEDAADSILESSSDAGLSSSQADERSLTIEEENYFNADDDDEEEEKVTTIDPAALSTSASPLRRSESSSVLSRYAGKTLPPSPSLKKQEDETEALEGEGQKTEGEVALAGKVEDAGATLPPTNSEAGTAPANNPATDPEQELAKIREKRKRAEDAEDEEDVLAKKKGSAVTSATGNAAKKNANAHPTSTSKLKLLFGKKVA